MTEVPIPRDEVKLPPRRRRSDVLVRKWIIAILIVVIVFAGIVIVNQFSQPYNAPQKNFNTTSGVDVETIPNFYYDGFSITDAETQTELPPEVWMDVMISDRGEDQWKPLTIYGALLDIDEETFETLSIEEWDTYVLYDEETSSDVNLQFTIAVHNYPNDYTWAVWFDCNKTDFWDVSIYVGMFYNQL